MLNIEIAGNTVSVSSTRVAREADRAFRWSKPRRQNRAEKYKRLVSSYAQSGNLDDSNGAVRQAAAILLSQGLAKV